MFVGHSPHAGNPATHIMLYIAHLITHVVVSSALHLEVHVKIYYSYSSPLMFIATHPHANSTHPNTHHMWLCPCPIEKHPRAAYHYHNHTTFTVLAIKSKSNQEHECVGKIALARVPMPTIPIPYMLLHHNHTQSTSIHDSTVVIHTSCPYCIKQSKNDITSRLPSYCICICLWQVTQMEVLTTNFYEAHRRSMPTKRRNAGGQIFRSSPSVTLWQIERYLLLLPEK